MAKDGAADRIKLKMEEITKLAVRHVGDRISLCGAQMKSKSLASLSTVLEHTHSIDEQVHHIEAVCELRAQLRLHCGDVFSSANSLIGRA